MKTTPSQNWIRRMRPLLRTRGRVGERGQSFLQGPSLRWAQHWGWEENILGVCLSWKRRTQRLTFLVECKLNEGRLTRRQCIPELLRHPKLGWEIPTRVLECGAPFTLQSPYSGTLRPGIPVGHEHGFPSGTLGLLVQRQLPAGGPRFILSCAHVLAWSRKGIFPLPAAGDLVEQPVSLDADPEEFRVAELTTVFTDLTSRSVRNDFALAEVLPSVRAENHALIRGVSVRSSANDFPRGLAVTMLGQFSGPANGVVEGLEASVRLPTFGNVSFPSWQYHNLILYRVNNTKGDSGAAIVETATGHALGLHVAGNGTLGLMYPVAPIFFDHSLQLIL